MVKLRAGGLVCLHQICRIPPVCSIHGPRFVLETRADVICEHNYRCALRRTLNRRRQKSALQSNLITPRATCSQFYSVIDNNKTARDFAHFPNIVDTSNHVCLSTNHYDCLEGLSKSRFHSNISLS